ncbi:MAG: murein biosynthesis integral membrane protein MurJ [Acidimicrobiales bacterium]
MTPPGAAASPRAGGTTRAAVGMGSITAVSRALGFVRVLVVAALLGTTFLGNAFQAANSLSNVLFELLAAGALSAVLVPTFVELLDRDDHAGVEEVAGGVLGLALAALGVVTVVGVVAAPTLARVLTIGVPASVAGEQRELVTYLLRFFVPQVLLYAAGTVATAVLYAKRRFAVTAAAPIGNTVVMVVSLVAFRIVAGPNPGLELGSGERLLLVLAGTGGVVAFVGSLLLACAAAGFRLRPRRPRGDARVAVLLRHSGWGVVLHTGAGALLGAAIVGGSAVEGGVVAYQVGWVVFLGPYAILAQPIHTAILPELVAEARDGGDLVFAASMRWALERMAVLVAPVAAAMIALALPGMRAVSFGETGARGVGLLAAAVAALAIGLYPYGAFLLLARGFYALGDSRTPGVVALAAAAAGVAVMGTGAALTEGAARVAVLGVGHSVAYGLGAAVLGALLSRRLGVSLVPAASARIVTVAAAVGAAAWVIHRSVLDAGTSRVADLVGVVAMATIGAGVVVVAYRLLGVSGALTARVPIPGLSPEIPEPLA